MSRGLLVVAVMRPKSPALFLICPEVGSIFPPVASTAFKLLIGFARFTCQSSIDLHLWVGDRDATVLYRGRSGCCAGVDQINFIVPDGVESCYVPITVQIGDSISPYSSMSIRSGGGTCSLPFGLTSAELDAARARGSIRLGNILLDYGGIADSIQSPTFYNVDLWGEGNGFFFNYPVDDYGTPDGFTFSDSLGPDYSGIGQQGVNTMLAVGTCMVGTLRRAYPDPQSALDAGRNIAITSSTTELMTPSNTFFRYGGPTNALHFNSYRNGNLLSIPYSAVPPSAPYRAFGPPLSVTNDGGGSGPVAVGSFIASPGVPQGLVWANIASTTVVNRTEGVRVTWGGGDPDGFVYINGVTPEGTGFSCLERASARSFTVPPSVTLALPAADGNTPNWGGLFLYLANMSNPVRFDATGLDAGFLSVSVGVARWVSFR